MRSKKIYLVIADYNEEFEVALTYVSYLAKAQKARVAVLYILEKEDFQIWGNVQERLEEDRRKQAENLLESSAKKVQEICGTRPVLHMEEGGKFDVVVDVIDKNPNIKKLILEGGKEVGNPGPLVSYFTTKGLLRLHIPLTIISPNLSIEDIRHIVAES